MSRGYLDWFKFETGDEGRRVRIIVPPDSMRASGRLADRTGCLKYAETCYASSVAEATLVLDEPLIVGSYTLKEVHVPWTWLEFGEMPVREEQND